MAASPAQAEIVHTNGLLEAQTRSASIHSGYERQFILSRDIRITDVIVKLSENRTSNATSVQTMTLSIGGTAFRFISHNTGAGEVTFAGDVTLSGGDVPVFALGADKRLNDKLTLGGFFQSGSSTANSGRDSETKAASLTAYGSYILSDTQYVQAAIGISDLSVAMHRQIAGDEDEGERDGATHHLLVNAAQRVPLQAYDVLLSVELGLRETTLSAYSEDLGADSYRYQKQNLRDDHIGVAARLDEGMDMVYGYLTLSGELGYRADISSDSQASLYRLSDTTTIYTHQIERSRGAYSLSHTRLALDVALARDNGWHYKARTSWQDYKTGYLAGISFSAAYRF